MNAKIIKNKLGIPRRATASDMEIIKKWLPKDYSIDTLAINWNLTMDEFHKGHVSVWEDAISKKPVAYWWGSLNSYSSIIEVQPEYRGSGVGRAVVEVMLQESRTNREPLLEFEIAPNSAEPFWKAMGFSTARKNGKCYGRRLLELPQDISEGTLCSVTVKFLPEQAISSNDVDPLAEFDLIGAEKKKGEITLETVAAYFRLPNDYDVVIEISIEGVVIYKDKAKREAAKAIGVVECENGYMISEVLVDKMRNENIL